MAKFCVTIQIRELSTYLWTMLLVVRGSLTARRVWSLDRMETSISLVVLALLIAIDSYPLMGNGLARDGS